MSVGFFAFVVILIMVFFVLWQTNISRQLTGYTLTGRFDQVAGLISGSEVRYRGYRVGRVTKVRPTPKYIDVTFWVESEVEITEGSTIKILFDGLVGENYLSIVPNLDSDVLIENNAILPGRSASDLAHFIDLGHENLVHTEIILKSLVALVEDGSVASDIRHILSNLNQLSGDIVDLFDSKNEYDIVSILTHLERSSSSMSAVFSQLEMLSYQTIVDDLLKDVSDVSLSVSQLTDTLAVLINEDELSKLSNTFTYLEDASEGLSHFIGKDSDSNDSFVKSIFNTSINNETAVYYDLSDSSGYLDSDVFFSYSNFSFITGISSRSGSTVFDQFQQGYRFNSGVQTRLGVYQNVEAIGIDYFGFSNSKVSVDVYDFSDPLFEFSVDYSLFKNFGVAVDINTEEDDSMDYNLGLKYQFD